jgi:putative selenium metabolism protein SsnA
MLALKNANIIQFYPPKVTKDVDIVIEDGVIIDLGRNASKKHRVTKTLKLENKYISPGIVCSHNHFYSALARGILAHVKPSRNFVGVLKHMWWKLDRALDEESLYLSGIVGALEAIKAGTTAVIDHNASPSFIKGSLTTLKGSFERIGLRGILAYEITDRNGETGMMEGIAESEAFCSLIQREKEQKPGLIEAAIGAHAPFTLGDRSLRLIADAVASSGRGVHIHVAEDKHDVTYSQRHYGKEPVARLDHFNILNDKSILVHGVYLSDKDIDIINKRDAFLVHNPRSNMNNAVGYMQQLGRVKNLALGTDGIGANMFEEAKFAYFKNTETRGNLAPGNVLRFLQNGNEILSRYFGRKFGKIKKGYAADIVIYDYDPPTPLTDENLGGHFMFGFSSRDVESVIVNGKIVFEEREFPFETAQFYREAQSAAQGLWKRMDRLR